MTNAKADAAHLRRMAGLCRKAASRAPDQEIYAKFITLAIDLEAKARDASGTEGNGAGLEDGYTS